MKERLELLLQHEAATEADRKDRRETCPNDHAICKRFRNQTKVSPRFRNRLWSERREMVTEPENLRALGACLLKIMAMNCRNQPISPLHCLRTYENESFLVNA